MKKKNMKKIKNSDSKTYSFYIGTIFYYSFRDIDNVQILNVY